MLVYLPDCLKGVFQERGWWDRMHMFLSFRYWKLHLRFFPSSTKFFLYFDQLPKIIARSRFLLLYTFPPPNTNLSNSPIIVSTTHPNVSPNSTSAPLPTCALIPSLSSAP